MFVSCEPGTGTSSDANSGYGTGHDLGTPGCDIGIGTGELVCYGTVGPYVRQPSCQCHHSNVATAVLGPVFSSLGRESQAAQVVLQRGLEGLV